MSVWVTDVMMCLVRWCCSSVFSVCPGCFLVRCCSVCFSVGAGVWFQFVFSSVFVARSVLVRLSVFVRVCAAMSGVQLGFFNILSVVCSAQ